MEEADNLEDGRRRWLKAAGLIIFEVQEEDGQIVLEQTRDKVLSDLCSDTKSKIIRLR
ncbi:hypothetical protein RchiOBHm_Chr1g0323181 [Rosa chinensis]|uniref:Uncharacterized protein n=1 Tax=Rosa chinensis TaxID=74649 RepID=A0A2P6S9D8_ROSCH|nr:hypothetical protein RchiOBHm_Chr1g0323181 [Rosa chinensis]